MGPGDYKSAGRKNNPAGKAYNKFFKKPPARYISNDDYSRNFIEYFMKERPRESHFAFGSGSRSRIGRTRTARASGAAKI